MENQRYTVILNYDPENSEVHGNVLDALSRIDSKAAKRIEATAIKGRIVLKRGAESGTAKRLKQIFQDTGAKCEIRKARNSTARSDDRPSQSTTQMAAQPRDTGTRLMACPNCGHEQVRDLECHSCGIIISKARSRGKTGENTAGAARPPQSSGVERPSGQGSQKYIAKLRIVANLLRKIHHYIGTDQWTGWAKKVADYLIRCVLVFVIALVLQVAYAGVMKMAWYLYIETTAGQHFVQSRPEQAEVIQTVAATDPLTLSVEITVLVLVVGLVVAFIVQFFHIVRYLFLSQGFIGKMALWYLPFIGFTAWVLGHREPYPEIILAATMVVVPALCMFSSCIYLAQAMLPEIGEFGKIFAIIADNKDRTLGYIIRKIRNWFDTAKQTD